MLPELSIERVFRRELDSLPVPAEQLWVPNRRTRPSAIVAVSVVGAALVLIIAAAGLIREASGAATQPRGAASAPPSLPARPTCAPPAFGANGRCTTLVPNSVQNPALGYNLTIPGDWREVQMPPGAEPFVREGLASPALTAPFLLGRQVFTARPPREWVLVTNNEVPAWDLDVQVWDRQGRTAVDWSRTFGPCEPAYVTLGVSTCARATETIRGTPFVVTTVSTLHGSQTRSYYLERGDQMLILRYRTDPNVGAPPGVTVETLQRIVHSIGLV
jgi:hypothetical protein